jgi:hypothetical protein
MQPGELAGLILIACLIGFLISILVWPEPSPEEFARMRAVARFHEVYHRKPRREWELAMFRATESVQAMASEMGRTVVPAMNEAAQRMNEAVNAFADFWKSRHK